jgi:hypothetical protein
MRFERDALEFAARRSEALLRKRKESGGPARDLARARTLAGNAGMALTDAKNPSVAGDRICAGEDRADLQRGVRSAPSSQRMALSGLLERRLLCAG